jgi:hypothetical protein
MIRRIEECAPSSSTLRPPSISGAPNHRGSLLDSVHIRIRAIETSDNAVSLSACAHCQCRTHRSMRNSMRRCTVGALHTQPLRPAILEFTSAVLQAICTCCDALRLCHYTYQSSCKCVLHTYVRPMRKSRARGRASAAASHGRTGATVKTAHI